MINEFKLIDGQKFKYVQWNYNGDIRVFKIADKAPRGFEVWNIGDDQIPGFIPFVRCLPGIYTVDVSTMVVVPCSNKDDYCAIMRAAWYGSNIKTLKRYLNGNISIESAKAIKRAIPLLQELKSR